MATEKKIIITSKADGLIVIGGPGIKVNGLDDAGTRLVPGTNEISESLWEACKPHCEYWLTAGILIPMTKEVKVKDAIVMQAVALKDMTAEQQVQVVNDCFDTVQLEAWKFQESVSDSLRVAILKRIDFLITEGNKEG